MFAGLSWLLCIGLATVARAGTLVESTSDPAAFAPDEIRAVAGDVVSSRSFWRAGRLLTESEVALDDGSTLMVRQVGGSDGAISVIQFPSRPIARPGDRLTLLVQGMQRDPRTKTAHPRIVDIVDVTRAGAALDESVRNFVQTTNERNVPLHWQHQCVFITYDVDGTTDIEGDLEFQVMDSVFQTWRDSTADCSYQTFEMNGRQEVVVAEDRQNVVTFREDEWGPVGCTEDPSLLCYNPNAAGITTVLFINSAGEERSGEILGADIEMNAVDFSVSHQGLTNGPPELCLADLANTLTHEVGHLLGLDHTCVPFDFTPGLDPDGQPRPWPVDSQGLEVPICGPGNPEYIRESTMNAFQACGETSKATPEADDIDAVCWVYWQPADPGECRLPESNSFATRDCSCRLGHRGSDSPPTPLVSLLLVGILLSWRIRRGRGPAAARCSDAGRSPLIESP